jgi:Carboxypeptidase regulatory-like domain/TonB dependent receptor/TonB-dependent Receptor Plug Domain
MQTIRQHRTLRRAVTAAVLFVGLAFQVTWALALTTGNIAGTVKDSKGAPIAGVQVQVVAPSMSRTATTDSGGHFIILSLAPDTYTVTLTKMNYQGISIPGVTVFADQTQQVAYTLQPALKTIGHVTSQAGASLVKAGVGGDLYSVNSAQAAAAAALSGGGNLNNAYSAMASVPGVQVSQGGIGWINNSTYVRGQNSYYTGYEYDGIPVNRAFDNYNSSTESTLGLQELQVYTGGGPSSVSSSGTAGFINQVIKTGTFPGFASTNLGAAYPNYYHQASVEIGGSTPDRTFSYYVGLSGYNQTYRFIDNSNGGGYNVPGGIFSGNPGGFGIGYGFGSNQVLAVGYTCLIGTCQGVKPMCPLYGAPWSNQPVAQIGQQGCWQFYSGTAGAPMQVSDRENVVNLHLGIPKANGLRDDVQLLWSGSALNNYYYLSPSDSGPGVNQFIYSFYGTKYHAPTCGPTTAAAWANLTVNGCSSPIGPAGQIASLTTYGPYFTCGATSPSGYTYTAGCAPTYLGYSDAVTYDVPFGTPIAKSPSNFKKPGVYFAPDSPPHPFDGPLSLYGNNSNVNQNDTGITKLQYTYSLSQAAYLRAYAYTFYSDWLETAPFNGATGQLLFGINGAAQYQLITHTAGGALDFQDQINDQNLITLNGNYTSASVIRFNNSTALGGTSPIGYMAKSGAPGGFTCFSPTYGTPQPCLTATYYDTTINGGSGGFVRPTWRSSAIGGPTAFAPAGSAAVRAGASWDSLWQGNANGSYNTVKPKFTNAALQDQFRPNDKLLINAAIRYDNFTYDLPDSLTAATAFYANLTANYTCVQAKTNQVLTQALPPGVPPPASAQYVVGDCNQAAAALFPGGVTKGWVHPNGTTQDGVAAPNFTATSPGSYSLDYWEPRFSGTYTINPDSVIRLSAGRFVQPPISASVQYLALAGDNRSVWNNTMNLGFYSPFHPIPGISSGQYDLSWEQHLKGTDMSFKLTPFYTWVSNWQQQTFIGAGFVTQVPVGVNRNEGVEFQFNKGDFTRNGLSGQLAVTYTNSKIMFQNVGLSTGGIVTNELGQINQAIAAYNALTHAGGGSPCYRAGKPVSCNAKPIVISSVTYDPIRNPYYNQAPQGLLAPGAWYNPYSTAIAPNLNGAVNSYISPWVSSLILNWRHDKLAITPSFSFQSGGYYGSPLDTEGLDPRVCQLNSAATGITKLSPKTDPLQCNYLTTSSPGAGTFTYLYVPNPQTGSYLFDNYQQPSSIVGNLQVSYDLSPKVRLMVLGANLFHDCFGGTSAPWTSAYPANYAICGYAPAGGSLNSTLYPSNFYNGTGIGDRKANGARTPWTQSYLPTPLNNGAIGASVQPINVYFNAQIKL